MIFLIGFYSKRKTYLGFSLRGPLLEKSGALITDKADRYFAELFSERTTPPQDGREDISENEMGKSLEREKFTVFEFHRYK